MLRVEFSKNFAFNLGLVVLLDGKVVDFVGKFQEFPVSAGMHSVEVRVNGMTIHRESVTVTKKTTGTTRLEIPLEYKTP